MAFPKPYADRVQKLRVPSGFIMLIAFCFLAKPTPQSFAIGVPVSLLGLLLRGWAAGHLAKNQSLATSGPYAYIRNPLYAGTLLVAAGLVIAASQWTLAILFAAVFAFIYLPVIELEEQHLRKLFPSYGDYARRVPLLIPRGRGADNTRTFEFGLYRRNEEYKALIAFAVAAVFLAWRSGLLTSAS
jgi:hypothetical protein